MMRTKITVLALLILLAGVGTGIFLWRNRDEARIRHSLNLLCEYVRKPRGESPAAGALKAAGLDKFLAPEVRFSSDSPRMERTFTPAEAKPLFIQLRNQCETIGVDLEILELKITGSRATAECNAAVSWLARGAAEKFTGLHRGRFELEIRDGKWKITRCALSAPMQ